jgi:hypothetical protein
MNERIQELLIEAHKQTNGGIYNGHLSEWTEKFAELIVQECIEQPDLEPFAYSYMGIRQDGSTHGPHLVWKPEYMDAMSASKGAVAIPLYTAPRQWIGLTEIEICDIEVDELPSASSETFSFARAIEEKLKEKNHAPHTTPLYTAPREWVELTDDEARALVNRATFGDRTNWQALVYMVDAKLKEKNHG